jgi:hypothetical protein
MRKTFITAYEFNYKFVSEIRELIHNIIYNYRFQSVLLLHQKPKNKNPKSYSKSVPLKVN